MADCVGSEKSDPDDYYDDDLDWADYPDDLLATTPGTSGDCGDFDSDPEYFEFDCLDLIDVERLLNELVANLTIKIPVNPALAKMLLAHHDWEVDKIVDRYHQRTNGGLEALLIETNVKPQDGRSQPLPEVSKGVKKCCVCIRLVPTSAFHCLACGHEFCADCWCQHFEFQLKLGISSAMECMSSGCAILVPEDFVLELLTKPDYRAKYQKFVFQDHIKSHPELRFCTGANCQTVIRAKRSLARRVVCKTCKTSFCFVCGLDYHVPTDCETIKRWLVKCADDSETANYITANTKDCPRCHICIEKNGGCNHMQCWKCKHHFCWMCLGDWKSHGSEYYECSRYKENPNIATEAVHVKAREALQKYLFYFERWENHNKSLKLEEQLLKRIKDRIDIKINKKEGTWIDWQYLYDAAALLTKCRYTLQYTYPFAYYMENGPRKNLFEYQQGQLEAEIENLSWKVERAETTDRGDLENQMHVAEQKRKTLLKDFP